jgi:hypothetical protein
MPDATTRHRSNRHDLVYQAATVAAIVLVLATAAIF